MSNIYDRILQRMIEYRDTYDLTQEQVGTMIGKTQSQLSKIELGKTIIAYEDLEELLSADWDIDYLITAKERIVWKTTVAEYFDVDSPGWKELRDVLIWAIGQAFLGEKSFEDKDVMCEYELLRLLTIQKEFGSLLFELRNITGITQTVMAEKLGVNIKKYRDLERRVTNPDAELLALIYEITSCRPSLFFYQDTIEEHLLNDLWNLLDEEWQRKIVVLLEYAAGLC